MCRAEGFRGSNDAGDAGAADGGADAADGGGDGSVADGGEDGSTADGGTDGSAADGGDGSSLAPACGTATTCERASSATATLGCGESCDVGVASCEGEIARFTDNGNPSCTACGAKVSEGKACVVAAYEGGTLTNAAECREGKAVAKFLGPCDNLDAVLGCWNTWMGSTFSQNPIHGP
ncbi:MAG: hypothetical protein U0169_15370 [Polyangiaceae bacterium]